MESIIIPSTKSLTLTNRIIDGNINGDNITVGNDRLYTYSSYLIFDISTIPRNAEISRAELVLFKTDNFYEDSSKRIYIYPLFDYFSAYTTYKNPPKVNHCIKGTLYPITSKISATANLTKIVSLWFKNTVPNKGIILCKRNNKRSNNLITNFGSAICKDSYLTPFIKVIYSVKNAIATNENHTNSKDGCNHNIGIYTPMKDEISRFSSKNIINLKKLKKLLLYCCRSPCPCPNPGIMRQVRVMGTVAPWSIYEATVNLSVNRSETSHTCNYYVTDKYDNSASNTPLTIDKIYNIAVLPQGNPKYTEKITFYGSYKR